MSQLLWLVPVLPLLGAIVNAFYGARLPRRTIGLIGAGSVAASFVVAVLAVLALSGLPGEERAFHQQLYSWIAAGQFQVNVGLLLDPLSAVMILVVTGVGALIHVYSIGYMEHERDLARFFTYMNLFVFSMLLLVLADNYLLLFVGWELVGLCSYLLIGFWYTRDAARSAAVKAFVTNRVGDFGFTLGVILMFWTFGSLSFQDVFERAPQLFSVGAPVITAITLLLFIGATGKSAQIPLFVWLPDAMEGPTPVSALIHAATMVTAGVYMVARSHVLFDLAPFTLALVAVIGGLTAFFAATVAVVQFDLKRLLAYSTISQLGYMFLALGVGAYASGIFHLMTHAFFKALLFLGAGAVMHAMSDVIDLRKLGGLRRIMPITFWTFLVGSLALAGFPLLSGFFSKDAILSNAFATGNYGLWFLGLLTALMTAFYILRGVYLTFLGRPRWQSGLVEGTFHPHEAPQVMTVPLIVLAVLSVIGGYVGLPAVLGQDLFAEFVAPALGEAHHATDPTLEWALIGTSVIAALVGLGAALWIYSGRTSIINRLIGYYPWLYDLLTNKYYVDQAYDAVIAKPARWVSNALWQVGDKRLIDGAAEGLGATLANVGRTLRGLQSGYARGYALAMLVGIVVVLAIVLAR